MRVIIESDDLSSCSPAIISRCGVLCATDELFTLKQIFNKYARGLPPILADLVEHFDRMVNFFWPDILDKYFREPVDKPIHLYFVYPITAKDAITNFLRLFECCVADYRDVNYQD